MMPSIAVITPASRGVDHLSHLVRDFKNQTLPKNLWSHIIVYDGQPSEEVQAFMGQHKNDYDLQFTWIPKDTGNMKIAPGTRPRNHGVLLAKNSTHCVFFDDDDRARDTYCETLVTGLTDNVMNVVQMSCQESRQYKNGDPTRIRLVPEIGLPTFPMICHVGTPCVIVKRDWALAEPWREEPEHDFRFIKRICERFKPQIRLVPGLSVDVDGLILQGLKDWVSMPPFYRGE